MAILNIFSPGWITTGMSTQFVAYPWASPGNPAGDVWIQCTVGAFQVNDTPSMCGFGILEIEFLDGNGNLQQQTFGDITNLNNIIPENLPTRLFVASLVSVTLALITYDIGPAGTVTLFQWG